MTDIKALRARLLHFINDPAVAGDKAYEYFADGLLLIKEGRVLAAGDAGNLLAEYDGPVETLPNHLLLPGFIDTHIHYPQTEMIAAYGEQLLGWLTTYTFPTELKFADKAYARQTAKVFLDELLRNGTTTALVFATVHPQSAEAFFEESAERGLRMIAGKVMMDRNAPEQLLDTAQTSYDQSKALIEQWHSHQRLSYAVTPRFAPTSSQAQLKMAGRLLKEYPGVYMHTHLAENTDEIAWVKDLFPEADTYLDAYDQAGLLSERSVFAHGIHLEDCDCKRLGQTGSAISHCPTSNLFLGSGLINLEKLQEHKINVGLGTDVGGGSSFSMFRTMDEAYKIQQLRGSNLSPLQALYLATLGGARALRLDDKIGSFKSGMEADFQVLDLAATPLLKYRLPNCNSLTELLFVLNTLGDDRVVERVYSMGKLCHSR